MEAFEKAIQEAIRVYEKLGMQICEANLCPILRDCLLFEIN